MKATLHPGSDRERLCTIIRGLDGDKAWDVEWKPHKTERSLQQNKALFGVAYPVIMEYSGLQGDRDKEALHEYWCGEFWGWSEFDLLGKKKVRPARTTTHDEHGKRNVISTIEFSDFYAFIQQRMAEVGVYVPDPEEQ